MRRIRHLVFLFVTIAFVAHHAEAGERVTLRNGFAMTCDHHSEAEGKVRIFPGVGEDNFIEFASNEVASFEPWTEPAPNPALDSTIKPSAAAAPAPGQAVVSAADTKLTPADLHLLLTKAGKEHHLDVDLLASLVKAESGGNARAVSRTGARGLMQLMPGTATDLGVSDSFKADQNVRGGTSYLDTLLTRYHENLALALAAYNAGPAAVDRYRGIPPFRETRAYVARVIHEFNRRVRLRETEAKRLAISVPAHAAETAR